MLVLLIIAPHEIKRDHVPGFAPRRPPPLKKRLIHGSERSAPLVSGTSTSNPKGIESDAVNSIRGTCDVCDAAELPIPRIARRKEVSSSAYRYRCAALSSSVAASLRRVVSARIDICHLSLQNVEC